jgi:hypothetical protein
VGRTCHPKEGAARRWHCGVDSVVEGQVLGPVWHCGAIHWGGDKCNREAPS